MADFVGDDIGLGEVSRGAEAALHILEERKIDVDLPVGRTIKGTHRRLRHAAGRLHDSREQDQGGGIVLPAHGLKFFSPHAFGRTKHTGDKILHLIACGRGIGIGGRRSRLLGGLRKLNAAAVQQLKRIDAEHQPNQEEHNDAADAKAAASADRNPHSAASGHAKTAAHAAAVLDVLTGSFTSEAHGLTPCFNTANPVSSADLSASVGVTTPGRRPSSTQPDKRRALSTAFRSIEVRWSPTFAAISIVSSQRQRNGHAGLPIQCLELKSEPTRIHVSDAKESFMAHVYKVVELVGSSSTSIEEAVNTALTRASETLRNLRWFEVLQTRGDIEDGKPAHFQVTLRVGFTLDDT